MTADSPARKGAWRRAAKDPLVLVSVAYLTLLLLTAAFAPWLAPYDPMSLNVENRLASPSREHWFGTDNLGRDQFSRVLFGSRIALQAALPTVAFAALLGVVYGLIAGYFGGWVDRIAMRVVDVLDAIPLLMLAIAMVAALGRGLNSALIGVALAFSVTYAKLCRGQVLVEREREYVDSARVMGIGHLRIMFREILPNAAAPLIVQTSIFLGLALLVEAMLSFLGLGAAAGEPSWGLMLDDARAYQARQPWLAVFPGLAISVTVLMFNLFGDGLRDAFDLTGPRGSGRKRGRPAAVEGRRPAAEVAAPGGPDRGGSLAVSRDPGPAAGDLAASSADAVITVADLRIEFPGPSGRAWVPVVRDVTFDVAKTEVFGLVGESGSGKSMTALAMAGLVPTPGVVTDGSVRLGELDLLQLKEKRLNSVRGRRIGMIFQSPMAALSPVHSIGRQISDPLRRHIGLSKKQARERSIELLRRVGVPAPERRIDDYPFQFSGGMAQRAVIAIALAAEPDLLIADEPTTALDVTVQEQVLDLLLGLRDEFGMSILLITHDLGVVADTCDRVAVMYAGQIVELGEVSEAFRSPKHPYTSALLEAMPQVGMEGGRLATIPGRVPPAWSWPSGCAFAPRCDHALDACTRAPIDLTGGSRCIRSDELTLRGSR